MKPILGNRIILTTQTESASRSGEIKEGLFRAATSISNVLQSFSEQIGGRTSAFGGPSANAANFSSPSAATANTAPLVQAQLAQCPVNPRDYGKPHPNIRFAAGVDAQAKYSEVTDIGLPDGISTSYDDHNNAKVSRPDPQTYLEPSYIQQHLSLFKDGAITFIMPSKFNEYTVGGNKSEYHGRPDGAFVLPANLCRQMIQDAKLKISDELKTRVSNGIQAGNALVQLNVNVEPLDSAGDHSAIYETRDKLVEIINTGRKAAATLQQDAKGDSSVLPDGLLVQVIEKAMGMPPGSWSNNNVKLFAVFIPNPLELGLRMASGTEGGASTEWRPGGYTTGGIPEAFVSKVTLDKCTLVPFQGLEEVLRHDLPVGINDPLI